MGTDPPEARAENPTPLWSAAQQVTHEALLAAVRAPAPVRTAGCYLCAGPQSADADDEPEAVCTWHLPRLLALLACEAGMPAGEWAPPRERERVGGGHTEE